MSERSTALSSLLAIATVAALLAGAGCTRLAPKPAAVEPTKAIAPVAVRSAVVSDSAGPEDVARAFILALSEDRPDDANALWGGSVKMFTGGLEYLEGSSELVLRDATSVRELPTPLARISPNAKATPSLRTSIEQEQKMRERYVSFAVVNGNATPRDQNQTPNPPDTFAFKVGLGRMPNGRWDVLTFSAAGENLP